MKERVEGWLEVVWSGGRRERGQKMNHHKDHTKTSTRTKWKYWSQQKASNIELSIFLGGGAVAPPLILTMSPLCRNPIMISIGDCVCMEKVNKRSYIIDIKAIHTSKKYDFFVRSRPLK